MTEAEFLEYDYCYDEYLAWEKDQAESEGE